MNLPLVIAIWVSAVLGLLQMPLVVLGGWNRVSTWRVLDFAALILLTHSLFMVAVLNTGWSFVTGVAAFGALTSLGALYVFVARCRQT